MQILNNQQNSAPFLSSFMRFAEFNTHKSKMFIDPFCVLNPGIHRVGSYFAGSIPPRSATSLKQLTAYWNTAHNLFLKYDFKENNVYAAMKRLWEQEENYVTGSNTSEFDSVIQSLKVYAGICL